MKEEKKRTERPSRLVLPRQKPTADAERRSRSARQRTRSARAAHAQRMRSASRSHRTIVAERQVRKQAVQEGHERGERPPPQVGSRDHFLEFIRVLFIQPQRALQHLDGRGQLRVQREGAAAGGRERKADNRVGARRAAGD
jgi:hypothetical protein